MNPVVRLARCDPALLDFMTWAVVKGCRLFQRIQLTAAALIATERIPRYDFVAVVPMSATLSVLTTRAEPRFPLPVTPQDYGERVGFWPDDSLTRGSLALVGYMAKALLLGAPRGVHCYLTTLSCDMRDEAGAAMQVAAEAQKAAAYRALMTPLMEQCATCDRAAFDAAVRHAYCLYRRHAIPFWSAAPGASRRGTGHPSLIASEFVQAGGGGDIMGMVPLIDHAQHAREPNAAVGYPDAEMLQWMRQEKRIAARTMSPDEGHDAGYFILQALRDIDRGEAITVDKNAFFQLDDDAFETWFGFANKDSAVDVRHAQTAAAPELEDALIA